MIKPPVYRFLQMIDVGIGLSVCRQRELPVAIGFAASIFIIFVISILSVAHAQTVEYNWAKKKIGKQIEYLPGSTRLDNTADDKPFGVNLKSLVIVDKRIQQALVKKSKPGLDLRWAGEWLQVPDFSAQLRRFVGQPLSQKLLLEIRSVITLYFRSINRPFITIFIPPQEISSGRLQVYVLTFRIGEKRPEGNIWTPDSYIMSTIREQPGDEIASDRLVDDINWLNLNPYRNLIAIFEPGEKPGTTNIILRSKETKPWTVYGGYANSGTSATGEHRIFNGFNFANLPFLDHQFGYQFTASPQVYESGSFFGLNHNKGYLSHSANYFAPLDWGNGNRHKLNFQANYVEAFSLLTPPFTQSNRTTRVYGEYAIPLPGSGSQKAELYAGLDFKRQKNDVFFSGALTKATTIDVFQFVAGIRSHFSAFNARSQSNLDLRIIASPSDVTKFNTNAAFVRASGNLNARADYVYLYADISHSLALGDAFSLNSQGAFQLTSRSLPALEQISIGGLNTVRGYATNETSGDIGFYLQNEIRVKSISFSGKSIPTTIGLSPFVLADMGIVHSKGSNKSSSLFGTGAGIDLTIGKNFTASLVAAVSLKSVPTTRKGTDRIYAKAVFKF